ncbi:MAG TPA: hypothetical protein VFO85_08865 [Vicinamibacteria bacterium]|nr:hypothetical protein [Vicinamibacteria bacterium]
MKAATAVLVTLLFGAGATAEAAWWPKKKLPKPLDYPVLRPKMKDAHKPGNRMKHPPTYSSLVTPAGTARA